jgi:hypothetical protein
MAVEAMHMLQEVLKPEVLTPLLQDSEVSMLVTCYLILCLKTGSTHAEHLWHLTPPCLRVVIPHTSDMGNHHKEFSAALMKFEMPACVRA